jgi:hypothetical protein
VSPTGDVITVGALSAPAMFDGEWLVPNANSRGFVARYHADGSYLWSRTLGIANPDGQSSLNSAAISFEYGGVTTNSEHLPVSHRKYAEESDVGFETWATTVGAQTLTARARLAGRRSSGVLQPLIPPRLFPTHDSRRPDLRRRRASSFAPHRISNRSRDREVLESERFCAHPPSLGVTMTHGVRTPAPSRVPRVFRVGVRRRPALGR